MKKFLLIFAVLVSPLSYADGISLDEAMAYCSRDANYARNVMEVRQEGHSQEVVTAVYPPDNFLQAMQLEIAFRTEVEADRRLAEMSTDLFMQDTRIMCLNSLRTKD